MLLRAASAALEAETGCVKTSVTLVAEQERFGHLHLHLVPRRADIAAEAKGPRVFAQAMDELALRLRARLNR